MTVAVPDGERLAEEVVLMDKDHKEKLKMEEHALVPQRKKRFRCIFIFYHVKIWSACPCSKDGEQARHNESGGSTKTSEGISRQSSRKRNDTNEVELRASANEHDDNVNELKQ